MLIYDCQEAGCYVPNALGKSGNSFKGNYTFSVLLYEYLGIKNLYGILLGGIWSCVYLGISSTNIKPYPFLQELK